jgi:hypothetical protein
MERVIGIVLAAALAGCSTTFPIQLRSDLTKEELAPYGERGERFISGQAFLRQAGGLVVTCAGETVTVLPAVDAVEEAIDIWRAGDEIYTVNLEYPNVSGSVRWVECDGGGNFIVEGLPAETYWVMVPVRWGVGKKRYGGMLAERVSLYHGPEERLILDEDDKLYSARPWELTDHLN